LILAINFKLIIHFNRQFRYGSLDILISTAGQLLGNSFNSETFADGRQFCFCVQQDVTVRKAYQKKIIGNEANVRSILNTIENSIWLINNDYELIDFNKEFFQVA